MKEQIPYYNIANMFFVGAVFAFVNIILFHNCLSNIDYSSQLYIVLKDWNIVVSAALVVVLFEVGFILNRTSSVIIAPILEKTKIWPKEKYDIDVSELSNKYPKFQSLITDFILIRTHVLMYIILLIESLFSQYKLFSLVCFILIAILVLSGRKHNSRINTIRKSYAEKQAIEKKHKRETNRPFSSVGNQKKSSVCQK